MHHSQLAGQPTWLLLIYSLGVFSLLNCTFSILKFLYVTFLRPQKNFKMYGSWALITGASDGIGRAFARQLPRFGLNLVLVSRNAAKLEKLSAEIQSEFPDTSIKIVAVDFSGSASTCVGPVLDAAEGVDIGILINNVGVTYPAATFFHEIEENGWMEIVRVNVEATTRITKGILQGMIQRKRGAIVNIGSGSAVVVPSHPLYTIYAATKAYIDQLSRCLYMEYKHFGIHVQCQVPLYVATKMTCRAASIQKPSLFVPSPSDYARAAIRHIGYESRCTPYWAHSLQWFCASLLPESVLDAWRLSIGIHRSRNQNPSTLIS